MRYVLSSIGDRSLDYISGQLKGGQGLAHLLGSVDLRDGEVQAFVSGDDASAAVTYDTGSLPSEAHEANAINALTSYLITSYGLTNRPGVALIGQFPDGAKRRPDVSPAKERAPYSTAWLTGAKPAYYNGELWYVDQHSTCDALEVMLHDLLWFPAVAAVVEVNEELVDDGAIDFGALARLVERPRAILIGAWDAMNYLLWAPSPE